MQFAKTDGLNWTVRTEKVQTESGLLIPDTISIVRDDTNVPLSVMASGYQPYQNHELIDLLEKITKQTGLPVVKSGYFGDGEKVFVQLKSDNLTIGNDRVEGYLTGVNSFDGSTSLAFGPSNVTISCTNTFYAAFRGLKSKVRHTKNMAVRIEDILRNLDNAMEEEKVLFKNIIQLSEISIGKNDVDSVIRKLFEVEKGIDLEDEEALSTNKRNKIIKFEIDLKTEIEGKGDNLWGLFSGVTKYTSHSLSKDSDSNMKNKMFGVYGERERRIFDSLLELA